MDLKSKIILIYGPTASGKSKVALKIARKIKGEVINADSMQVYKELKILSARPSLNDCQKIKHHLYGFQTVKKNFSTGDWLKLVNKKITYLREKNKIPIIVGGTGLYFKALTHGLIKIPKIPIKVREKVRILQKKFGTKKFYSELIKIDPLVKNRLSATDTQRIIRAYEIKLHTKKSMYLWFKNTKSKYKEDDFLKIYIDCPKNELLKKIERRSKKMMRKGAISEVKNLLRLKISGSKSAYKAIGVSEVREFLEKKIKKDQVAEKISIKTRQYAKRQRTWGRGNMSEWNIINPSDFRLFLKKKLYIN